VNIVPRGKGEKELFIELKEPEIICLQSIEAFIF